MKNRKRKELNIPWVLTFHNASSFRWKEKNTREFDSQPSI